jgi:hypothetical protein
LPSQSRFNLADVGLDLKELILYQRTDESQDIVYMQQNSSHA